MAAQTLRWCFTVNNPTQPIPFDSADMDYLVYQKERGAEGTEHYQGFVIFKCRKRMQGAKSYIGPTAHMEQTKGTSQQASDYCKKTDTQIEPPLEYGEVPVSNQGKRNDLQVILDAIKTNNPCLEEMKDTAAYVRNYNCLERYQQQQQEPRRFKPLVYWIYGKTGVGKSRWVNDNELDLCVADVHNSFFLQYDNEEAILFDDIRSTTFHFNYLLRLLDRYPMKINIKNGMRVFNSKRIYITCPWNFTKLFEDVNDENLDQLKRRITRVIHMDGTTLFDHSLITLNDLEIDLTL